MKNIQRIKWILLFLLILIMFSFYTIWQADGDDFADPLPLTMQLAANFGEVREGHFHMGIDIRTNGKENIPVYAVDEGYISRISIQEKGFGKAVFVTHPNGTTTVYAHLRKFNDKLETIIRTKQYSDEKWQQDTSFPANSLPIRKGAMLAMSGNTGNSQGPHLHFEIRDTKTGKNINPLTKFYRYKDNFDPIINGIYWYDRRFSIYSVEAHELQMSTTRNIQTVYTPLLGIGIEAADKMDHSSFKFGVYKASVIMDDRLQFSFKMDSITEKETRNVYARVDQQQFTRSKKTVQYLFRLPGNKIYSGNTGNGSLDLSDKKTHNITIITEDIAGNKSKVNFAVRYKTGTGYITDERGRAGVPGKTNRIDEKFAGIDLPAGALYDTVRLLLSKKTSEEKTAASPLVQVSNVAVALQEACKISLATNLEANSPLRHRTVMKMISGNTFHITKGSWKGNRMEGSFTELGTVQLLIDTIPPVITMQAVTKESFTVRCNDNLGDIAYVRAEADGHWLLLEKKGSLFTYRYDEHYTKGSHTLEIIAKDKAGNTSRKSFYMTRD